MGKNLAFADILLDLQDDADAGLLLVCNAQELLPQTNSSERKIEVIFQRGVPGSVWDPNPSLDSTFPHKNAALPYGALVRLDVCDPAENTKPYRVKTWKILKNPREEAIEAAKEGRVEGISSSVYLKVRGKAFSKFNDNMPPHDKKERDAKRSESGLRQNNTKEVVQAGMYFHGDNRTKAMRSKIFASWLIETYGRETLAAGRGVLDVAGGKGKLSIQLALQGNIHSTIIDPIVRKHGAKPEKKSSM